MAHRAEQTVNPPVAEDNKLVFFRDDPSDLPSPSPSGKKVKMRGLLPAWLVLVMDVVLLGASLITFALFHHVIPRKMGFKGVQTYGEPGDWSEKWAEFFTSDGSVEITDTTYRSGDVYVSMSTVKEDNLTYYVADIYVASIYSFRTAFANDTYGKGYTQTTLTQAKNNDAVVAVNGDYYGFREQGIVVRNGLVYRTEIWEDACVLYYNGVLETYSKDEFDMQQAIDGGAWQAWSFGPSLLDKEGKAITSYESSIDGYHPRTAIGYFEPGHYCFVAIDGRQTGHSLGMSFENMAKLFESMGCTAAYNLDGGKTSVMAFMDKVYNRPYEGGRKVSDILYIGEPVFPEPEK